MLRLQQETIDKMMAQIAPQDYIDFAKNARSSFEPNDVRYHRTLIKDYNPGDKNRKTIIT